MDERVWERSLSNHVLLPHTQEFRFHRQTIVITMVSYGVLLTGRVKSWTLKSSVICINLNIDVTPVDSRSYTHPSHSQTSLLSVTSSLSTTKFHSITVKHRCLLYSLQRWCLVEFVFTGLGDKRVHDRSVSHRLVGWGNDKETDFCFLVRTVCSWGNRRLQRRSYTVKTTGSFDGSKPWEVIVLR